MNRLGQKNVMWTFNIEKPREQKRKKPLAFHRKTKEPKEKIPQERINSHKVEEELHLRKAVAAKRMQTEAVNRFKDDETAAVIYFEKVLPTPKLTRSEVFYSK
ncbi:hypothetical protein JTB14_017716 [Gonioctena quinquepunctata]|nr:hypothetical protein JTB14_017716 [Gonioctena quinquepunctata]